MAKRVELTVENHVAEVMLNRPEKYNALDLDLLRELSAVGELLKTRDDVRAVVLHGAGKNFCAGIDLHTLQNELSDTSGSAVKALEPLEGERANFFQKPAYVWRELKIPVIAALQGVVFGGGCQIALGADIRYGAPDVRLSVMEIKWGIIPDMGSSQLLFGLVRDDVARELLYTGREVAAEEALSLGLLSHISDDPLLAARAMAATIATKNPEAIRACKVLLNEAPLLSAAEGLKLEAQLQLTVLGRPKQLEAVRANIEKRPPEF